MSCTIHNSGHLVCKSGVYRLNSIRTRWCAMTAFSRACRRCIACRTPNGLFCTKTCI